MNKMKKLLSVVLAVVLAFSALSVLGSAAKAEYYTVQNLRDLDAYSEYGQVTRLDTETRMSIIMDSLDTLLAKANINPGKLFDLLGLSLTVDLRSIDAICGTIDNVKSLLGNWLVGIAGGALGIVGDLNLDSWTSGRRRSGAQLDIVRELLAVLNDNKGIVYDVISKGTIDLGLASSALGSLDLSIIQDIPGLIKGLVFPLIERWDDSLSLIKEYDTASKGNGNVNATVNNRVKKLFNDNMSITTVKYNADGGMTSEHTGMPIYTTKPGTPTNDSPRCYYYQEGNTLKIYHIVDAAEAKASEKTDKVLTAYTYVEQEETYYLEQEVEGSATYVWKSTDELGNVTTLKYYNDNSPFLKGISGDDIDLTTMSAGDLLYKFFPVVFEEMAPVVLNGSVKKILAGFFGANFTHLGKAGTDAVAGLGDDPIFAEEQGEYLWEWSDYAVIGDNHYYRYLDDVYVADLSATNNYFDIINWNYEIDGNFMNDFLPENDDDASKRLLLNLNDFIVAVAEKITVASATTVNRPTGETEEWVRPTFVKGGNSNLVQNIKKAAQAVVKLAPEHIFGSDFETNPRCYYDLLVSTDDNKVLVGIAAQLVDIIMPSMTLPTAEELDDSEARVGAILAAVIREFAAYLTPEFNYDALIYADYGTGEEGDKVKTFLAGKDSEYWFDVCLTMGINAGFEYLRAFSDMGEGTAEWDAFVAYSGYGVDGKTYAAGTTREALNAEWEGMLDYIVDWALEKDYKWTWKMENFVNTTNLTIDLATGQDPWVKLDQILDTLLPVDEILNIEGEEALGMTELEKLLRHDLILGIVDLRWDELINVLQFNGTNKYFRTANVLDQLAKLLKGIVNGLFKKVGGGSYALIPEGVNTFDELANQGNLATMVRDLLGALNTAYSNGLLDTALPIVNMFIGWKMDPQVIADPTVWVTNNEDKDYAYITSGTISGTSVNFLNNSSGMLEIHRNSDVVDKEYTIKIESVTSDATVNTLEFDKGDGLCSPYETLAIKVGGTYKGEEAVTITIGYSYLGKDGEPIGEVMYTSETIFFSNQKEDADIVEGDKEIWSNIGASQTRKAYNKYIFAEDIYAAITGETSAVQYSSANGDKNLSQYEAPNKAIKVVVDDKGTDCEDDDVVDWVPNDLPSHNDYAEVYFTYNTQSESGFPSNIKASVGSAATGSGHFYKSVDGYGADYEYPYGTYAFRDVALCYEENEAIWQHVFIHYDDYGIDELYAENKDNDYHAFQGVDSAIYNAYNTAWKEVVRLATYPMMTKANGHASTDYVEVIMEQIQPAMEAFELAKEEYETALAKAQTSAGAADTNLPATIVALQEEIDNDFVNDKEIDFQDYEFYEYFNYNDVKVAAENLYRSYLAPEIMDKYYIQGSGIREAELDDVIAAESNPFIAAGITASRMENKQDAIDASIKARDEWKQPIHTKLYIEDFTSRLGFYKKFLNETSREGTEHLYFLEKELAHIDAQGLNAEDYEAVTWGRYEAAYNHAVAVAEGSAEHSDYNSTIYAARHDLMIRYKELMLKEDSLIEAKGTVELNASIEKANEIFASLAAGDGVWTLSEEYTGEAEDAYAALISALGYYYVGEDGNTWNLYADSALEYADNDRPNKQANQAKVDAANDKLVAAMDNFVEAGSDEPAEPNTIMLKEDAPYEAYIDLNNTIGGEYTGTIYGIDTLGCNDSFEADGALADFLTTAYGDDYLEIIESSGETTGTVINVLGEDGEVVESYMFIYFGDVDMDGWVGASDAFVCEYYEIMGEGIETLDQFMAGDVDGDAFPGAGDAFVMEYFEIMGEGMPLQTEVASIAIELYFELL